VSTAIFTRDEIERRWAALWDRVTEVDCVVVPSFHNSYYLSGTPMIQYGRWAITVLFRAGGPVLVLPEFERDSAGTNSPIALRCYSDTEGPSLDVAVGHAVATLRERGVGRVGIEAGGTPASMLAQFEEALAEVGFVDVTEDIDAVRLISSPQEHALMQAASRICDVGMAVALAELRPGVDESWLCAEILAAMQRESSPEHVVSRVECYMQQGGRSLATHAPAMKVPVASGKVIMINAQTHVHHYMAGVERMVMVGEVPDAIRRNYETVQQAFVATRDAIRPGVTFDALFEAGQQVFADAGLDYVINTGGLVRNILDVGGGRIPAGDIRPGNLTELQRGMVLSIEPWSAIPGFGSHRHCEMVLVTEDGWELMSHTDSGILRIG
jgi:Xaa-Pro aminopeptidase